MDVRSTDQATDCGPESTDWTTIGARILEAALIATAIHQHECARRAESAGDATLALQGRAPAAAGAGEAW